jgi:rRNA processing protein Gar1
MRAAKPIVHEARTPAGFDGNGYTVPESWADPGVDRQVFSWEPEHLDVEVTAGYQMRVTNRQLVMVDDINPFKPNDHVVLGKTVATVSDDDVRLRVDEIRDYQNSPVGMISAVFGPAPGVLVVEHISG